GCVLSLADFTDRKRIADELQESEEKYRTLVERSYDAVFMIQDDRFIFVNDKMCQMTGYTRDELRIMFLWDTIHIEDREPMRGYIEQRRRKAPSPDTYIIRLEKKSGEIRMFEFAPQEIAYKSGRALLVTARDVTEHQQAEENLRKANEELERINRVKTEFTSIISHELRTPLGTTKQAIEIMLEGIDGPLSTKQSERLIIAKRNVDRLVRLTNNVLDFAKLETGRMELIFEDTNMNELMIDVEKLMKPAVEAKNLSLALDLPPDVCMIQCDADRIRQTVINLIDNAIKHTDEGGKIRLGLVRSDGGVRVEVEDTGRGIAQEDMPKLFEPFRQLQTKGVRPAHGSGLGLSICKQVVDMHGGRIEVQSELGKGSLFAIILPAARPKS
ncbi:MAG: PAS domain-containing sensor histidine kinase, partial [bacterium]